MIQTFVERWDRRKDEVRTELAAKHPSEYADVVRAVVKALRSDDDYDADIPSPERIHLIDDGDYQGTLVFVIGSEGYQPSTYWFVKVAYGSCSGCDTLEAIRGYQHDTPTAAQVDDYMTLALHVVQGLKAMDGDSV